MESGNTSGNIMNSATCLEYSGRMFYVGEDFFTYRADMNLNNPVRVGKEFSGYLNGYRGRVYFTDLDNHIHSMDTDGGDILKLNDSSSFCMNVTDNRIFYRNETDGKRIHSMDLDGSDDVRVCNDVSFFLNIHKGYAYYRSDSNAKRLYKLNLRTGEKYPLTEDIVYYPVIYGDRIYYSDKTQDGKIHSMDLNGNDDVCIRADIEGYYLNVHDDLIFYRNYRDGHSLHCMRLDGSDDRQLIPDDIFQINIAGGWLFYCQKNLGGRVCHMRLEDVL